MNGNQLAGEILKGHAGQYRNFSYPQGALIQQEEDECLSGILPGDKDRGNQTLRYVSCNNGRRLLVSAYSAAQKNRSVGAIYQHAAFFENFQQWFESNAAHEVVFFHFAGEEDFQSVASGQMQLSNGWHRCGAGLEETLCQLPLTPDQQADLACCCLYKGMTNVFGSLVILVPGSEDYAAYCRTVMERVLSCVPIGLWRYLSFATNPDETGKKNFAILFAPEGTTVQSGEQTAIWLDDSVWPVRHHLRHETAELIRAAAENPTILKTVSEELEREERLEDLTEERYVNFWQQHQLRLNPLDCATLKQYCGQLGQRLSKRERGRLEKELRDRLSAPGTLEHILRMDEELLRAASSKTLDAGLKAYDAVFHVLDRGLDRAFSTELLDRMLPLGHRTLEQLDEDAARLDRCQSAGEGGVLDAAAVRECREALQRETEEANRRRKEDFEREIPAGWDWSHLRTLVEQLKPCQEHVRSDCLNDLSQLAVEYLERSSLSENGTQEFYAQMVELVGDGPERDPLNRWYQEWQQRLEERQRVLEYMTSYWDYMKLERPDGECLQYLLNRFEQEENRNAGIQELLRAAELKWSEAWPCLLDRLDGLLKELQQEQRLGVWLEPKKSLAELYSELLACRMIEQNVGEIRLQLWYQDAGKAKSVRLSKVLETVGLLQQMMLDGRQNGSDRCNQETLQALQDAGMIQEENRELLQDMPNTKNPERLDKKAERKGGKHPQRKKKLWPAFVGLRQSREENKEPLQGMPNIRNPERLGRKAGRKGGKHFQEPRKLRFSFVALVIAAVALLLAIIVALALMLTSGGDVRSTVGQGTEQSSTPSSSSPGVQPSTSGGAEQVIPSQSSPSSSQDGEEWVTPFQGDHIKYFSQIDLQTLD